MWLPEVWLVAHNRRLLSGGWRGEPRATTDEAVRDARREAKRVDRRTPSETPCGCGIGVEWGVREVDVGALSLVSTDGALSIVAGGELSLCEGA